MTSGVAPEPTDVAVDRPVERLPRAARGWLPVGLVAALLAVGCRLWLEGRSGLTGVGAYDDGIYYAASANVLHGFLPYRDFLLLHPPGITLLLAPFVWVGSHTSDATGLILARLAVMGLGGVTTLLIVRLVSRWGLLPAATSGLVYAVLYPAAYSERTILLEPVGSLAMVVALLLVPRRGTGGTWRPVLAGAVLGLAAVTKIWYVLPLLVFLAFQTRRDAVRVAVGAAVSAIVVGGPFFVMAPGPFVRDILLDQGGRPANSSGVVGRLSSLLGDLVAPRGWPVPVRGTILLLLLGCALLALTVVGARCVTAMLVANTMLLLAAQVFYLHYVAFVAPLFAVVLGAAVAALCRWARRSSAPGERGPTRYAGARLAVVGAPVLAVLLLGVVLVSSVPRLAKGADGPFPARTLRPAIASVTGCVTAQDPTTLALLDTLTRDLDEGCRIHPDTTGWFYDDQIMDRHDGDWTPKIHNPRWQALELRYLQSGAATVIRGHRGIALSNATMSTLRSGGVVARAGTFRIFRTPALGPFRLPR